MVVARRWPVRGVLSALLACVLSHAGGAGAETVTQRLTVRAEITAGCWFGALGSAQLGQSLGVIDFGTVQKLDKDMTTVSSVGAGSVVMTCTPGTDFRVDINDGQNAGASASGRKLKHATSGNVLKYELYRDSSHSLRWGANSEGMRMTAPGGRIELPVYAKLQSAATQPSPGVYTDELIVTVYY